MFTIPEIVWKNALLREAIALGHGWSQVGWVEGKKRFRLFWDNSRNMTVLKDNCDGKTCDIPNGCQGPAKRLAIRWLEESL